MEQCSSFQLNFLNSYRIHKFKLSNIYSNNKFNNHDNSLPDTSNAFIRRQFQNILQVVTKAVVPILTSNILLSPDMAKASVVDDYYSVNSSSGFSAVGIDMNRITSVAYLNVKIANYTEESSGTNKAASGSGEIVIGLYGNDAPLSVARFLETVESNGTKLPTYLNSQFSRIVDDTLLEIDENLRLDVANIAGVPQYQYEGNILMDYKPILEANTLRHDR